MDEKTTAVLRKLLDEAFEKNFIRLFNQGFEALISDRLGNLETGQEELKADVGEVKDQLNSLERKVDRFHDNQEQRVTKLEKIRGVL